MEKNEYIRHLKLLIKKYHPDLCKDDLLESIYNEISIKLIDTLKKIRNEDNYENKNITVAKEHDYYIYKLGIKYYKKIHPDIFYKYHSNETYETKTYKEIVSVLNDIFISFNLAEYYFNLIISDYPKSSWHDDAIEKIKLLKTLKERYKNINFEENKVTNYTQYVVEMGLKKI
jgi:hypothetical protein